MHLKESCGKTQILPVIHYLDVRTAIDQASLAFEARADGVFLISHDGLDSELPEVARAIKFAHPNKLVGLNFLTYGVEAASLDAFEYGLDMVWGDVCGVSSAGITDLGLRLSNFFIEHSSIQLFASVAFKYQPIENDPVLAAKNALGAGFIPTTSGASTGHPPAIEKIQSMSSATGRTLAVASGMSVENVSQYANYLSHILVATAVSLDDHHFDLELLSRFVSLARNESGRNLRGAEAAISLALAANT